MPTPSTNGHTTHPEVKSTAEQLTEARTQRELLQEQMQVILLERQKKRLEGMGDERAGLLQEARRLVEELKQKKENGERLTEDWFDTWTPWSGGLGLDANGWHRPNLLIDTTFSRKGGKDWPRIFTEIDLDRERNFSRQLIYDNAHAKGLLRNYCNYVIGSGPKLKFTPRNDIGEGHEEHAEKLAKLGTKYLEGWAKRQKFGKTVREALWRIKQDGEAFLRHYVYNGELVLRWIEPVYIRNKPGGTEAEGWTLGIQHRVFSDGTEDVQTIINYHVVHSTLLQQHRACEGGKAKWPTPIEDDKRTATGEVVPARRILHLKNFDTPGTVKRGLPEFRGETAGGLIRASALLSATMEGNTERALIAWVNQWASATNAGITAFAPTGDGSGLDTCGRFWFGTGKRGPYEVNVPKGHEYVERPHSADTASDIEAFQAGLGAGGVTFCAPKYWLGDTGDASYASSKEYGSPIMRESETAQEELTEPVRQLAMKAVQVRVRRGQLPPELLQFCELQVEMPKLMVRDRGETIKEEMELATVQPGMAEPVQSMQTTRMNLGLNQDQEKKNIKLEQKENPPPEAPGPGGPKPPDGGGPQIPTHDGPPRPPAPTVTQPKMEDRPDRVRESALSAVRTADFAGTTGLQESAQALPVFIYGTLLDPRVRAKVVGNVSEAPAQLPGYKKTDDRHYPDLDADNGESVEGIALDATPEQIAALDKWEGSDGYKRVKVTLADGQQAWAYTRRQAVREELDVAGHQHKGTGPGGGQFTKGDGGSKSTAEKITSAFRSAAKFMSSKGKAIYNKLPSPVRKVIQGYLKARFSLYLGAQAAAKSILTERHGPERAEQVGRILLAADWAGQFAGTPLAPFTAGASLTSSFVPVASVAYCLFSTATNPAATIRAAKKAISATMQRLGNVGMTPRLAEEIKDDVETVVDAMDDQTDGEWFTALVCVALDECKGDMDAALELGSEAVKSERPEQDDGDDDLADLFRLNEEYNPEIHGGFLEWEKTQKPQQIRENKLGQNDLVSEDSQEQAEAIADLLLALYGDDALAMFDSEQRITEAWNADLHPRGPKGRFITRGSAEAVSATKEKIHAALKAPASKEGLGEILSHVNLLTVAQIKALAKEHGVKGSGKNREELVRKIADRLNRGRREDGEKESHKMSKEAIGKRLDELLARNGPRKQIDDQLKKAESSFDFNHTIHNHKNGGKVITKVKWENGRQEKEIVAGPFQTEDELSDAYHSIRDEQLRPLKEKKAALQKELDELLKADNADNVPIDLNAKEPQEKTEPREEHIDALNQAKQTDKQFQGGGRYEAEVWMKLRDRNPDAALPKLTKQGAEYVADEYDAAGKPVPAEVLKDYPDLSPKQPEPKAAEKPAEPPTKPAEKPAPTEHTSKETENNVMNFNNLKDAAAAGTDLGQLHAQFDQYFGSLSAKEAEELAAKAGYTVKGKAAALAKLKDVLAGLSVSTYRGDVIAEILEKSSFSTLTGASTASTIRTVDEKPVPTQGEKKMETTTGKVKVEAESVHGKSEKEVEIQLVRNKAGELEIKDAGTIQYVTVKVNDLLTLAGKIKEKEFEAQPRDGILYGKGTPVGKSQRQEIGIEVAGRPEHQALYDAAVAAKKQIEDAHQQLWQEQREQSAGRDREELKAIQDKLPAGRVAAKFFNVQSGGADGWGNTSLYKTADGRVIGWENGLGIEPASDHTTGTGGYTTYISVPDAAFEAQEKAKQATAAVAADAQKAAAAQRQAKTAKLLAVEVPAAAKAAYERYQGDDDRAWEKSDETAWGLIRKYRDAIEAQAKGGAK